MPGQTPKLGLPYPLPTDPIADGATQIRALAEKLDEQNVNVEYGEFQVPLHMETDKNFDFPVKITFKQQWSRAPKVILTAGNGVSTTNSVAVFTHQSLIISPTGFNGTLTWNSTGLAYFGTVKVQYVVVPAS